MRTTETYTTTLNSFKRFMHSQKRDRDIPFDNVDSNLMIEYEQYLKISGHLSEQYFLLHEKSQGHV